jgi:mannose-6-phosphate isomerase
LLIKWLAAEDKLSLQVHPPAAVAKRMGAEPKTEFWYVAKADSDAQLFVGLRQQTTKEDFRRCIEDGTVAEHVHPISVTEGDAMFLPAGRFHAIGAGNLLVEVQQNSDTTYRVFDWNRTDDAGNLRELHVEPALECIDFADCQPELVRPNGEILVRDQLFEVQKWTVAAPRPIAPVGQFALVCCLDGEMKCAGISLAPGEFCLVPAELANRRIEPAKKQATLLRITIPEPVS